RNKPLRWAHRSGAIPSPSDRPLNRVPASTLGDTSARPLATVLPMPGDASPPLTLLGHWRIRARFPTRTLPFVAYHASDRTPLLPPVETEPASAKLGSAQQRNGLLSPPGLGGEG